ncbi:MAG: acyltransferase [Bacteroidetes bacterium]|nr:acyltransferase [Bacteroidota bacterium]
MKRIYFKGLNEIRAIAAFFVVFHHVELYKNRDGITSLFDTFLKPFISGLGKNGVYIFFVLSGFLITYLLLSEKTANQKIDLKKFYIRRILRIWPLYYLIVIISFFVIPALALNIKALQKKTFYYDQILFLLNSPYEVFFLFILFLPNIALKLKPAVVGASQAWSVGVEEQFYIIWPQLINRMNKKYLLILFIGIAALPYWITPLHFISITLARYLTIAIQLLPIHFMAIGGIGAFAIFYYNSQLNKFLNNNLLFIINTIFFILLLFFSFNKIIFGFVIILEILFIIQDNFRINLRSRYLNKTGEISYGIYMYHPIIMYFSFSFLNWSIHMDQNTMIYNLLIYGCVFCMTLFISYISYAFFEKKFIEYKNRKYTVIPSGKHV